MNWLLITVIVYIVVAIGCLIAMYREAPKHEARIGLVHFLVAFIWPVWLIWMGWLFVDEKFRDWRERR